MKTVVNPLAEDEINYRAVLEPPREVKFVRQTGLYKQLKMLAKNHDGGEIETSITDMLADLRHLCDEYSLDFAEIDSRAYHHYAEEV